MRRPTIRPFKEEPRHYGRNGLLLRSDVHKLFDAGYVTATPEYEFEVSDRIHTDFDDMEAVPMTPTEFQEAVWAHVRQIPSGKVTTYGSVAEALGRPVGAALAIGGALRKCPPDVPWWRVVREGGHLIVAGDLRFAQIVMLEAEGIKLNLTVPPRRIL